MNEIDRSFDQVVSIIETSRDNAYRKVNEELILMYWNVGKFLSEQSKNASYGDGYIDSLASYIQNQFPGIKGFNRRGLYRMKQFFELYNGNEKVSPLVTQLSWTNHLLIMSGCKSDEEREFYMRLAIRERYSKRELERQMDTGYYERYMLSKEKLLPEKISSELNPFLDSYVIEFLDLPPKFKEKHLKKGLIEGMKKFILELGKDFAYINEEYTITVGGESSAAHDVEKMGATHIQTQETEVISDKQNMIFTTPCYMLDASIADIAESAENLIKTMLDNI